MAEQIDFSAFERKHVVHVCDDGCGDAAINDYIDANCLFNHELIMQIILGVQISLLLYYFPSLDSLTLGDDEARRPSSSLY